MTRFSESKSLLASLSQVSRRGTRASRLHSPAILRARHLLSRAMQFSIEPAKVSSCVLSDTPPSVQWYHNRRWPGSFRICGESATPEIVANQQLLKLWGLERVGWGLATLRQQCRWGQPSRFGPESVHAAADGGVRQHRKLVVGSGSTQHRLLGDVFSRWQRIGCWPAQR
jgi:hypothetical protein